MLIEHQQQQCNNNNKKSNTGEFKQLGLDRIEIAQTHRPSSLIQRVSSWIYKSDRTCSVQL